jgi:hypothetical protein
MGKEKCEMLSEHGRDRLDVSRIVPQAQSIVHAPATVYLHHLGQWCMGVLVHGSGLKGDYIAGCSEIDFHLYLEPAAFTQKGQLPLEVCLALQRDLAQIEPFPFQYMQGQALPPSPWKGYLGPIPGAYQVVAGTLPIPEATEEELRLSARTALEKLDPPMAYLTEGLLEHGGGRLAYRVRLLCTEVWPMLYHLLTLQQGNGLGMWNLPKRKAMDLLPKESASAQTLLAFYQAIRSYYPVAASVEEGLRAIESGVAFLQSVKSWWNEINASSQSRKILTGVR